MLDNSADRIPEILTWSSKYNLYRKQQNCPGLSSKLKCQIELRMKNHCGEFFHLEPLCGFGSDFVYAKFSEINVIIPVRVKGGMSLRNGM